MLISVVIPVHNEAESLPKFLARLVPVLESLDATWEAIFVEDTSSDDTWNILKAASSDRRIRALRLSRSFGHQGALTAGIHAAVGDAIITMDGDLQHPPEAIPALIAKAVEGYEVVYGVRSASDSEGWFKRLTGQAFYWTFNRLTRADLPKGVADFRYMSRAVVGALEQMPERNRFLRGMTRWVGFSQSTIEYDRAKREGGSSKYNIVAMVRLATDGITAFSTVPLKIAGVLGLAVAALGGAYGVYVVARQVFGQVPVQGFTALAVVVLVLGGVQLMSIGVMGQYLGRTYDESKQRPLFLIWEDTHKSTPKESDIDPRRLPIATGGRSGIAAGLVTDRTQPATEPPED